MKGSGVDYIIDDDGIKKGNGKNKSFFSKIPFVKKETKASGATKAAKLLLALGAEQASEIIKRLNKQEIEAIVAEMSKIRYLDKEEKKQILEEFKTVVEEGNGSIMGGPARAREILSAALGENKAQEFLNDLDRHDLRLDFEFLQNIDPSLLASTLSGEHPQVAAVALSYISPKVAAHVLKQMDSDFRTEVSIRIAQTSRIHPDAVHNIAKVLKEKFQKKSNEIYSEIRGSQTLADILNHLDRKTEEGIMKKIEKSAPDIAPNIRELLYTFEELTNLTLKEMRLLLSEVNDDTILASALRGAGEDIRRHFFNALSQNRASDILEEMEYRGPLAIQEIHEARSYILSVARRLDDEGTIVIKKDREEYV